MTAVPLFTQRFRQKVKISSIFEDKVQNKSKKKKKIQYFHQSYDIFVFGSKIIKLSVSHIEKINLENFTLRARHLKNLKNVHWILTRLDDVNRTILIKVSPFRVLFIFPFHLAGIK